jgi:maltooligosyltrehalose synthase
LIVAPKWLAGSGMEQNFSAQEQFWGDTSIKLPGHAAASWRNILTGESIAIQGKQDAGLSVSHALKNFPVGLLLRT